MSLESLKGTCGAECEGHAELREDSAFITFPSDDMLLFISRASCIAHLLLSMPLFKTLSDPAKSTSVKVPLRTLLVPGLAGS